MREGPALVATRLVYGQAEGFVVWRNQSGFYQEDDRAIRYGVGKGGADTLGIAPGGLFLAVEVKSSTGKLTDEQRRFLQLVYDLGGVACVCRSKEEAEKQVDGIRKGGRRFGW